MIYSVNYIHVVEFSTYWIEIFCHAEFFKFNRVESYWVGLTELDEFNFFKMFLSIKFISKESSKIQQIQCNLKNPQYFTVTNRTKFNHIITNFK